MNKFLILLFIFIVNCSSDKAISEKKKIKERKALETRELFKKKDSLNKELNLNVKINLTSKLSNNTATGYLNSNNARINFNGKLKQTAKFKFSKIKNFNRYDPNIIFYKEGLLFFDKKGSILNFDHSSKLIWKKNFYSKSERKLKPFLNFSNNNNILIITDSLANYYSIDINSGKLLWKKTNSSPFNSQIKIYKNKFYVVDFETVLRCFSIKDGKELWNVKTDTTFVKSQQKLSIVIINNNIIFSNSIGDISAVDSDTGDLIWQTPTQDSSIYQSAFELKTSTLVSNSKVLLFSNNKNQFFSIDANNGILNWQQKVNSNIRPEIIDGLIFTVTLEGFLIVIENKTGNIIRITNIFDRFKEKKRSKIKPIGFEIGTEKIYLTTDNGFLIVINLLDGKSLSMIKIDNKKISKPFINNKNLYIIKDNSIIRLN